MQLSSSTSTSTSAERSHDDQGSGEDRGGISEVAYHACLELHCTIVCYSTLNLHCNTYFAMYYTLVYCMHTIVYRNILQVYCSMYTTAYFSVHSRTAQQNISLQRVGMEKSRDLACTQATASRLFPTNQITVDSSPAQQVGQTLITLLGWYQVDHFG